MTDGTRLVVGRVMTVIAVSAALTGSVWLLWIGATERFSRDWVLHNAVLAVGFGSIVWLVMPKQPRNAAVWVLAWTAVFTGVYCLVTAASSQVIIDLSIAADIRELTPSELPLRLALLMNAGTWLYLPLFFSLTIAWLLFPDGSPPSRKWRWATPTMLGATIISAIGIGWVFRPSSEVAYSFATDAEGTFRDMGPLVGVAQAVTIAMVPVCVAGLIVKFRRSTGIERLQFRWVLLGGIVSAMVLVPAIGYTVATRVDAVRWPLLAALVFLISAYGIAIAKYRLYDVDLVISRTLVYGALAMFIGAVYVAIALGPWIVLGSQARDDTWPGIVATVVVAVSFQPFRRRLERVANRIVYGRRATPYQVLSSFSQGISAVDPGVLKEVARSLAEGTTAQSASIWVDRVGSMQCIASWPEVPGLDTPSGVSAPVRHDGEELGRVVLEVRAGQPFPLTDQRLLDQVAAGLGLALRNLLLTEDLRRRVGELDASRRRVVQLQDETRRKLERDLHDGAQQRLVALKIKLGIGASMAGKAGLSDVEECLDVIGHETDQTIESVRDFARGIYPPLLEAEGLGAALSARARRFSIPVTVQGAGLGRYPKDQEATVYFCVLEALQNASKHSGAGSIVVGLEDGDGSLRFEVRDDGAGFDPGMVDRGQGLINISDRLEALGGTIDIMSTPGHGTLVTGTVPIPVVVESR